MPTNTSTTVLKNTLNQNNIDYKNLLTMDFKKQSNLASLCASLHGVQLLNQHNYDKLVSFLDSGVQSLAVSLLRDAFEHVLKHDPILLDQNFFDASLNIAGGSKDSYCVYHLAECLIELEHKTLLNAQVQQTLLQIARKEAKSGQATNLKHLCKFIQEADNLEQQTLDTLLSYPALFKYKDILLELNKNKLLMNNNLLLLQHFNLAFPSKTPFLPITFLYAETIPDGCQSAFKGQRINQKELDKLALDWSRHLLIELEEFNESLSKQVTIKPHLTDLLNELSKLDKSPMRLAPQQYFALLTTLKKALPLDGHKPTAEDMDKLVHMGYNIQTSPASQLKSIGTNMMIMGSLLAVAAGITLSVTSFGLLSAVGIACGLVGVGSALMGLSFFAQGQRIQSSRQRMTQDIDNLMDTQKADAVIAYATGREPFDVNEPQTLQIKA